MSNDSKLSTFPTEILLHVFELAADNYDPKRKPSLDVKNPGQSPWSKDLRVKKAIVRVCKTWRDVALEQLYHRVYLHRVGQLFALVQTLENNLGYAALVRHIHGEFGVSQEIDEGIVYYKNVIELLTLCSSRETFSWHVVTSDRGSGEIPLFGPFSTMTMIFQGCPLVHSSFSLLSLRTLSFKFALGDFTYGMALSEWESLASINLPSLEDLTCEAKEFLGICFVEIVSVKFKMPNLRHLTLAFPCFASNHPKEDANGICRMLERHGGTITSFTINPSRYMSYFGTCDRSLEDIIKLTPNLTSIKFPSTAFLAKRLMFVSPFKSLCTLELYAFEDDVEGFEGAHTSAALQSLFTIAANRANFPYLHSVVVYNRDVPDVPFFGYIHPFHRQEAFQYFLDWSRRFREVGIALISVNDEPLISPDQERLNDWGDDAGIGSSEDETE